MKTYVYLSLLPEALIASNLPPDEFGSYMAVGTKKRSRGQAIFFEVDPNFDSDYLPMREVEQRCQPHASGAPRRSAYLGVYRVLEHVPVARLGRLYLVTDDGMVLGLARAEYKTEPGRRYHLYQEFCPFTPRVVSSLPPPEFAKRITNRSEPVSTERIVFADMRLEELANNPDATDVENLPYYNIEHLRDCLRELVKKSGKPTKTVIRNWPGDILFRTLRSGFFVGDAKEFAFYKMPSRDELEGTYYTWWRSALTQFGG